MYNIKNFKQFESIFFSDSEKKFFSDLEDIMLELKDDGMIVDIILKRREIIDGGHIRPGEYEIKISKQGAKPIKWPEIKDAVIRITEYCYSNYWSVRYWLDGNEFMSGFKKSSDFDGILDDMFECFYKELRITSFSFKMLISRL
jgi:hypothetical protein